MNNLYIGNIIATLITRKVDGALVIDNPKRYALPGCKVMTEEEVYAWAAETGEQVSRTPTRKTPVYARAK